MEKLLIDEIRAATVDLPLYQGGPGVDYTNAKHAYAASIALLHVPDGQKAHAGSEALLVQRSGGDWHSGVWGNISGYVDTMHDPTRQIPDEVFDPIMFTVRAELSEECGLADEAIDEISFRLGRRFAEPRFGGKGVVHVLPILGICSGGQKPLVQPDGRELIDYAWVPLKQLPYRPNLSPGYLAHTLPGALSVLGKSVAQIVKGG